MPSPVSIAPAADLIRDRIVNSTKTTSIADVTRAEWARFLEVYRPLEDKVLARAMQTDFTAEGNESGATARAGLASAAGTLERNLRRSGAALTAEERNALARRRTTSTSRASAGAENLTRRGLREESTNLLGQMVGIGRGVSATAQSGLSSVADLQAQRAIFNEQAKTAGRNQTLGTLASAASLAIAFL